jgi:hypothetical protein
MFKIIGADQKEYGPVPVEQLRQWVIEGRLNAQTQARREGETEWKPLSAFAEFAEVLRTTSVQPTPFGGGGSAPAPIEAVLARDYQLDIGQCITRAWELLKANFLPVVGISFLIILISAAINQLIGLVSGPAVRGMILQRHVSPGGMGIVLGTSLVGSPIYTILMGGLFNYYLKLIRGQAPNIGDAFAGFGPATGQLLLLGLVNGFLTTLGYLLCIIPGLYLSVSWMFALPLVIDRNMPFWEAMELSRRVTAKHFFLLLAFLFVIGLLAACGILACCIGLLVTVPLASLSLMYAYEDIFGRQAT